MHTAYRISRSRSSGQLRIAAVFVAMAALAGAQQVRPDQIGYFVSSGGAPGTWNWFLDANGDGRWDAGETLGYIGQSGDIAVVGDWNGSGTKKIGIFRNGLWVLDYNGTGWWGGPPFDRAIYLGQAGDIPVVGDWNGDGRDKVGVFRNGLWVLDYNGNGVWEGTGAREDPTKDLYTFFGQAGDIPVVGDWNGSGTKKIGVFRPGTNPRGYWILDNNGDFQWDGGDRYYTFCGASDSNCGVGDTPVVGRWPVSGTTSPQFTLSPNPSSRSTVQGGSAQYQVTVTPSGGFNGTVVLSAQGLPIGGSAAFSPASVTGSGSSYLTLTTNNPNTPLGSVPISVTGTSGNAVGAGTVVVLTVTSPT